MRNSSSKVTKEKKETSKSSPEASQLLLDVGEKIYNQRKALGMRQNQLAKKVGISLRALSNYECGNHPMNIHTLRKLAEELNISTDELLGLKTHKNDNFDSKTIISMLKKSTAFLEEYFAE